jgi:prephenate dehydratase
MSVIAALGPAQTYSERAACAYVEATGSKALVRLYPTIRQTFSAVDGDCSMAVLPIENLVDGYVQPVLDLLLHGELLIVDELLLPIQFAFVANSSDQQQVTRVFAQFSTQGQCSEFLASLPSALVVTTESNSHSLAQVREGRDCEGAIVPGHVLSGGSFALVLDDVNDYSHNLTRFIVVARQEAPLVDGRAYKTSFVVVEGTDRPGLLAEVLAAFSRRSINMVSIMSRPTKESMGSYHFFIDIEGHAKQPHIAEALAEVQQHNFVRLLGSYPRARLVG